MAELSPGTTLTHYRIISKIGAGGMGEVYRAQDSELGRPVALKFLSGEVAAHQTRLKRFIQEAKAVSALNHPNILTVYEIGRADDATFIATRITRRNLFSIVFPTYDGSTDDTALRVAEIEGYSEDPA